MAAPHPNSQNDAFATDRRAGLLSGVMAYILWGFFPIYFKATEQAGALEILAHRVIWAVPFGLLIIAARRQFRDVIYAVKDRKTLALLCLAAIALAANWGVYIWAVQIGEILQASLGYYINPLLYVLVGVVFFKERLTRLQGLAVALAAMGVGVLAVYGGQFPAISIFLACSFGLYGVIRKQVNIGAMPGLFIETVVLLPVALIYMVVLSRTGTQMFGSAGELDLTVLLIAAGPITVLPLLCFAVAARKLKLSTLGFLQFIAPTLQFICGLYYGEAFTPARALCFGFIWVAVIIFMWDGLRVRPKPSVA